jgi:hypothetical protein
LAITVTLRPVLDPEAATGAGYFPDAWPSPTSMVSDTPEEP